jgi:aconitate hydratase
MAGLPFELLYPRRIAVVLTGRLSGWTAPKDVILWLAGQLGVSGATNAIVEYIGPGARTISATGKATICNMGAEIGATTSVFPADEFTRRYLRATRREAEMRDDMVPDVEVEADPASYYDRVVALDLATLEPHIVGPHSPDRARPLSQLAQEGFLDAISVALIGSCTNSSYEDMSRAADVAAQAAAHGVTTSAHLSVTPGSARVRATLERDGQLHELAKIGATVLASACGPCIGQWDRQWKRAQSGETNTIVTSYNRNFAGRNDGNKSTLSFIASPEITVALALAGRLSFDPSRDSLLGVGGESFRLKPPLPAPDVPERAFADDAASYVAPPNGEAPEPRIDSHSARLQRLLPWPAWDGKDFVELPVVVKAKGKTTTDQISPAGPWLRFRGHLEHFSDNLLIGVRPGVAAEARALRAQKKRWVIVGDTNYGEGSSREHAALSPRLLSAAAVIARSFARIHETNLKKQGLLALTFANAADYDRIVEGDRVTLARLSELAPNRPVHCIVAHADGSRDEVELRHSYTAAQLAWFRAGSALNAALGAKNES